MILKQKIRFPFRLASARLAAGFSLVEITLALGIVAFGLVGIVGVLPIAMTSSRQSFDKNRAVAIADTLFASFRSQPFNKVGYYDDQFDNNGTLKSTVSDALDLNAQKASSSTVNFYATFLDVSAPADNSTDTFGTQRRLRFSSAQPTSGGGYYLVQMNFNNTPDGTEITSPQAVASNGQPTVPAQANRIELIIWPNTRPQDVTDQSAAKRKDQYHFVSVIANRTN